MPLDVIIVGAGPAGMSAALWARDLKLEFAVYEAERPGGQLHWTHNPVSNYLGFSGKSGAPVAAGFLEHLERRGVGITRGVVSRIAADEPAVEVNGEHISAAYLVLATGVRKRRLNVPGESELEGKGVTLSASRDAHLFAGKRVLVVGGGDAALEESLILSKQGADVLLVHRRSDFSARPDFCERVRNDPRIETRMETELVSINGRDWVESATLRHAGNEESAVVQGAIVSVGVIPNSELIAAQVDLDDSGYALTDSRGRTSVDRVYAVGDLRQHASLTIAGATGDATTAVKDISRRIGASHESHE